ncbi:MAG TPA: SDR family oxidoreductase [Actinomycetes bacterium]|nr:SDR family oxidoreductase [Actinomycetes bacterium]
MDLGLADRVFVVTGGSRGLGRATAEVLVAEGARVVLAARDAGPLSEAAAALGGADRALGVPTDLAQAGAEERLVAAAVARFGRLDGALISTGGPPAGSVMETSDGAWHAAFETVFLGPVRVAKAVANAISDDGGAITFVLSSSAREPISGLSLSNGLRPGLAGVVKDLSDELASAGIRVNGLLPGRITTDRTLELDAKAGRGDSARRRNESSIPMGRYGDPIEFGTIAAFTLSAAASYVTGALIPIDGGARRSL